MAVCLEYQVVAMREERSWPLGATSLRWIGAALVMLLLGVIGARVFVRAQLVDLGYELSRERARFESLLLEKRELLLAKSVLEREDTLAARALEVAGLHAPDLSSVRRISISE